MLLILELEGSVEGVARRAVFAIKLREAHEGKRTRRTDVLV